MRKAFNFYRSYYDIAKELSEKDRALFLWAVIQKQFEGIEPNLTGMALFAYTSQKHSIDSQITGYETKTKTKLTPSVGGSVGGSQGASVQEKGEEKEKEKEEYSLDKRKLKFAESIKPFVQKFGKEMCNNFFAYWTEPTHAGKKMRYELERTWDVSLRLNTWSKNNFSQPKQQPKAYAGDGLL